MLNSSLPGMFLPNVIERFAPLAAIDYVLPSTGVRVGQVFIAVNTTSNASLLTVRSSDGDLVESIAQGMVQLVALQDTPTDGSHWLVVAVMSPQVINFVIGPTTWGATNTNANVGQFTVPRGRWRLGGKLSWNTNAATTLTTSGSFHGGFGIVSGPILVDTQTKINNGVFTNNTVANNLAVPFISYIVTNLVPTIYYVNQITQYGGTAGTTDAVVIAERIG